MGDRFCRSTGICVGAGEMNRTPDLLVTNEGEKEFRCVDLSIGININQQLTSKELGEAAGAPAGAIAQVMGHKPSATAEGYRPRSVDALRPFLELIEAHILKLAGVQFDADAKPGKLRVVAGK